MRCPDCNKFVGMDTDTEPEVDESGFDADTGEGNITVRIVNNCTECSTELKEANLEVEFDLSDAIEEAKEPEEEGGESPDCDFSFDVDVTRTDRTEGKGRGLRTFYGVDVTLTLMNNGTVIATETLHDEVQASGMDELV